MTVGSLWRRWMWNPVTQREPWSAWDSLAAEIAPHAHAAAMGASSNATYTLGEAVRQRNVLALLRQFPRTTISILLGMYVVGVLMIEAGMIQVVWLCGFVLLIWMLAPGNNSRRRRLILLRTARERSASIATPLLSRDTHAREEAESELARRHSRWRKYIQRKIDDESFRWSPLYPDAKLWNTLGLATLMIGNYLLLMLAPPSRTNPGWIPYFFPLGLIALLSLHRGFRYVEKNRLRQLLATMEGTQCPSCTFPLPHSPVNSTRADTPPINLGPPRCPECGCRWPLVPPVMTFS